MWSSSEYGLNNNPVEFVRIITGKSSTAQGKATSDGCCAMCCDPLSGHSKFDQLKTKLVNALQKEGHVVSLSTPIEEINAMIDAGGIDLKGKIYRATSGVKDLPGNAIDKMFAGKFIELDGKCNEIFLGVTRVFVSNLKTLVEKLRSGEILQDQLVDPTSNEAQALRKSKRLHVALNAIDFAMGYEPTSGMDIESHVKDKIRDKCVDGKCGLHNCNEKIFNAKPEERKVLFCREHKTQWLRTLVAINKCAIDIVRQEARMGKTLWNAE